MAKKKRVVKRDMTTKEFATIAGVTAKTVQRYCREIHEGNFTLSDILAEKLGLVSVGRLPDNSWNLNVKVPR